MRDIDRFRLVLHLAESLNYGRTAADCHVSTATLSRTVRRVEADAAARLFERGPRGVAVTEEGRRFCAYARESVRLWEHYAEPDEESTDTVELTGRLRIFASLTAAEAMIPDLLAPFRSAYPRVELDLRTGDAAAALSHLDEGAADVAVAALPNRVPAHLVSREVRRTPLVFVVAATPDTGASDAVSPAGTDASGDMDGADGWAEGPFVPPGRDWRAAPPTDGFARWRRDRCR